MSDDIQDALDKIFAIDSALYQERGFPRCSILIWPMPGHDRVTCFIATTWM